MSLLKQITLVIMILLTEVSYSQTFPNPATLSTGQGSPGTFDPIWLVSDLFPSNPPNPLSLSYSPALINNNCAPGAWVNPSALPAPINNGNWITGSSTPCNSNTIGGYIYFRLPLNLPTTCNGNDISNNGTYTLFLSGYVDNNITDVFVNGVSQGISGGWYTIDNPLNITLNGPWQSGLNYVDIQVFNIPGGNINPYGLLLVADYNASSDNDADGDGISDLTDACPCEPGGLPDGCCSTPTNVPLFDLINPINYGETFTLPSTSLNGITGNWSPIPNFTSTTTYTFTPLDGQCSLETSLTVEVIDLNQKCCANITNTYNNQTLLNTYYPPQLNQIIPAGSSTINLDAVPSTDIYGNSFGDTPIQAGDLLLIIQMQGADYNSSNSNLFGSGLNNSGPDGLGATGYTNLQNTGNYEFVVALNDVPLTGGILQINGDCDGGFVNTYTNTLATSNSVIQSFQVIRVPRFQDLILNNDVITTAWNGRVGGVITFEVAGELDLNGHSINASGRGFRGGFQNVRPSGINNNIITTTNNNLSSGKGEGISGTPRFMWNGINPVDYGVNWIGYPGGDYGRGAPGNAGGGGNVHNAGGGGGGNGGSGGLGGNGHAGSGNTAAFPNGGRMGSDVSTTIETIFMGGGGGGGDANNATTGVKGGPGGGVILLQVGNLKGTGSILSNGFNGEAGFFFGNPDGAGGGGAGGSILIITNTPSPNTNLTIEVKGGRGGDTLNDLNDSHGPGGGGGGGVLIHNIIDGSINTQLQGGQNGLTVNGLGIAHGASAGQQGIETVVEEGWNQNIIADLFPNPEAYFEVSNVCVGENVLINNLSNVIDLQNSSIVQFLWDFGDGATSNDANPDYSYTNQGNYSITLEVTTNWGCKDTYTTNIQVENSITPSFTQVADICSGDTLTALPMTSNNGVTGAWSPALDNTATTTYTFTPDAGQCATTATMTITVNPNIAPTFTQVADICSGDSSAALPMTSNNGYTGTWSPALDNTATTTYTFTPDAGQCATTATMTIMVFQLPSEPSGPSQQLFCAIDSPTISDLAINSLNVIWYNVPSGGEALNLNTPLTNGMVLYASAYDILTLCESETRFTVQIEVEDPSPPNIQTSVSYCLESGSMISSLPSVGSPINWYDSPFGGSPLPSDHLLMDGEILYGASLSPSTSCESTTRTPLEIEIVDSRLTYYNLLTVDGNGLNESLKIQGIERFQRNRMEIFNRYGNMVWSTINYDNTSNVFKGAANVDGIVSKGSYLPSGTYFFILSYPNDCEFTQLTGFVHLDNKL